MGSTLDLGLLSGLKLLTQALDDLSPTLAISLADLGAFDFLSKLFLLRTFRVDSEVYPCKFSRNSPALDFAYGTAVARATVRFAARARVGHRSRPASDLQRPTVRVISSMLARILE